MTTPAPPLTAPDRLDDQLAAAGWAVLDAHRLADRLALQADAALAWRPFWQDLPRDRYLKDGGHYRRRRHHSFTVHDGRLAAVPHRAHWQPLAYNALHGGLERWFEPVQPALLEHPAWQRLLTGLAGIAGRLRGDAGACWYGEAHLFRIDTTDGIGRPTPEGAHRDGVELVAVMLVERHAIKGGETRVFDARGPQGVRFTLDEPFSILLLDDERVIHETTPIQPLSDATVGHRDTLVVTLRRGGFQDPPGHNPAPLSR